MKILVMGSGAVGGYYGAVLHRAGQDVAFVARGAHLAAIRDGGLRVESVTSGNFVIHPKVVDRPDAAATPELVLYCVKAYDNEEALELLRPAVGPDTAMLTLQNGIGSGEQLGAAFGQGKVLLGVTYVGAARTEPGVIREDGGPCNIVFGEEDGRRSARAVAVYGVLHGAGIATELSTNVTNALWSKLVYICALSGMMCITRSRFTEVLDTPATLDLTRKVLREAEAVAKAKGIDLGDGFIDDVMAEFVEYSGMMISSMYGDLVRGSPLEVNALNGAVSRIGHETGVPTPMNDFITACLTPAHNLALASRARA